RPEHAREVLQAAGLGPQDVTVALLDLADQASVKDFAEDFLSSGFLETGLDLLINNAAVMACPEQRVGPGWESQFAPTIWATSR
ncbi:MAG: oxidoreductase, partial [Arthrobacter sp.]